MTRHGSRRSSHVAAEKPLPPTPPAEVRAEGPVPPAGPAVRVNWTWRLVLFLWTTSFIFLLLYEWLSGLMKVL